uniref:Uncharacterized protein n=1 Tax=Glossina austeni TaxID=7395 RepID=A0A1A9UDU7_GLOAU
MQEKLLQIFGSNRVALIPTSYSVNVTEGTAQSAYHSSTWTAKSMSDEYLKWDNTIKATSVVANFCNKGPDIGHAGNQRYVWHIVSVFSRPLFDSIFNSSFVERLKVKEAPNSLELAYRFKCGHRTSYG